MGDLVRTQITGKHHSITVFGAGHVGLVTAAGFAELGHSVVCHDVDVERIAALRRGEMPFHEPDLDVLVERHQRAGHLRFTDDPEDALREAEFVFIAVGTPSTDVGLPDLKYVRLAVDAVVRHSNGRRPILVSKSTAPVGISETLDGVFVDGDSVEPLPVVANPEFLREGTAVRDFLAPDRVVLGSSDEAARAAVAELYESLDCPVLLTDIKTAEMVKYASNAFLATKISFINEIAGICERVDANVRDVSLGMGLDRRIGDKFLNAGIGFGGSCLPKDVKALAHLAEAYGSHPQLLHAVLQINGDQPRRVISRLREVLGSLRGASVAVLGLAFKPGTDDIREAPALNLIRLLDFEEARIRACDPVAIPATRKLFPDLTYDEDPYEVARDCDAVIVTTEWEAFAELDLGRLRRVMRTPVLVDGRNVFDPDEVRQEGFVYLACGMAEDAGVRANRRVAV